MDVVFPAHQDPGIGDETRNFPNFFQEDKGETSLRQHGSCGMCVRGWAGWEFQAFPRGFAIPTLTRIWERGAGALECSRITPCLHPGKTQPGMSDGNNSSSEQAIPKPLPSLSIPRTHSSNPAAIPEFDPNLFLMFHAELERAQALHPKELRVLLDPKFPSLENPGKSSLERILGGAGPASPARMKIPTRMRSTRR